MFKAAKEEINLVFESESIRKATLINSNLIEVLFEHLKAQLFSEASGVFAERLVIVPSYPMQQWIQLRLAETLPIASGIKFYFLEKGLEYLRKKCFQSQRSFFVPTPLQQTINIKNQIDQALQSPDPIWFPLIHYVDKNLSQTSARDELHEIVDELRKAQRDRKEVNIEDNIADERSYEDRDKIVQGIRGVFWDRFNERKAIALAHHLSKLFERHSVYAGKAAERWEKDPQTWLEALWSRIFQEWDYPHRVYENTLSPASVPTNLTVHLFAFSHLSPLYFTFLCRIATHIPLFFYNLSPCKEFWSDHSSPDPSLLNSLGKLGREMAQGIESSDRIEIEEYYVALRGDSQLHRIQKDLLFLRKTEEILEDDSIEIHLCGTPHQEIIHLHEQLRQLVSQGGIEPKEIVVMAPNITHYAPYIEALFTEELRYQISDLPAVSTQPAIALFFLLLNLEAKRWSNSAILEIFDHPLFRHKHSFSEEDVEEIRTWVEETGVTWGFDNEHRSKILKKRSCHHVSDDPIGTWSSGLGHLIAELATSPYDPALKPRIHFSQAELLGNVLTLLQGLYIQLQQLDVDKTLKGWYDLFKTLLATHFPESSECSPLYAALEPLSQAADLFVETHYSFPFIYSLLEENIGSETLTVHKNNLQTVRFCSLMPMRAIPAKVICLIGMNHDAFPRQETEIFPQHYYSPSRVDCDRYLFLEALLSAREKLWISYQGRDPYNLKELPPSSVVAELFPFITKKRTLCTYSDPVKELTSSVYVRTVESFTLPQGDFVIDISALSRLAHSAIQHYLYGNDLKINSPYRSGASFALTPLQKSIIRTAGVRMPLESVLRKSKKEGILPIGMLGRLAEMQLKDELAPLSSQSVGSFVLKPVSFSVNTSLTVTLTGKLEGVFSDGLLTAQQCQIKGAARVWPLLLALNACDRSKRILQFATTQEKKELFFDDPIPCLRSFMEYYFYAHAHPIPIVADWIEPILKKDPNKIAHIPIYDAALDWYLTGRQRIDYEQLVSSYSPLIEKIYKEMVDAWF